MRDQKSDAYILYKLPKHTVMHQTKNSTKSHTRS